MIYPLTILIPLLKVTFCVVVMTNYLDILIAIVRRVAVNMMYGQKVPRPHSAINTGRSIQEPFIPPSAPFKFFCSTVPEIVAAPATESVAPFDTGRMTFERTTADQTSKHRSSSLFGFGERPARTRSGTKDSNGVRIIADLIRRSLEKLATFSTGSLKHFSTFSRLNFLRTFTAARAGRSSKMGVKSFNDFSADSTGKCRAAAGQIF